MELEETEAMKNVDDYEAIRRACFIEISRRTSQADQVANKLAKEWRDSGETLESMLAALREVRAEYYDKNPQDFS